MTKICSIAECNRPHYARGWCNAHYQKWKRTGDPLYKYKPITAGSCTIDGCNKKIHAKGLCFKHYERQRKYNRLTRIRRKPETGCFFINEDGYEVFIINRKKYFSHRIVMEEHLGRKLNGSEVVHHINGNKLDNRIENLELFKNKSAHRINYPRSTILSIIGRMGSIID